MEQAGTGRTKDALIVFARVPEPGRVKTRLIPYLTAEEAADLYAAFLRDALDQYLALGVAVRLYLAPPEGAMLPGWIPPAVDRFEQRGEDLGARMRRAFLETFVAGYERVVIIGTDHPTLPTAFIAQAFAALETPRTVVLGPSEDGGYYLLGMNEFYPEAFHEMTYSHDRVFVDTLARLAETPAVPVILPPWYDVDTPEALRRLRDDLDTSAEGCLHTRRVLARLGRSGRRPGGILGE
ncbi:MAG: hypothetical protein KatS3mg044_1259 [Rhodothermaceae bacterium]|nr:MAG: glycosyltransferase [Bacteroidota bacterium]GIV62393.1 MAG: hypothetical protein KatS3mg044_1259 [Rhodothermaceae bacterium]